MPIEDDGLLSLNTIFSRGESSACSGREIVCIIHTNSNCKIELFRCDHYELD